MLSAVCLFLAAQTTPKNLEELAERSRAAYASLKGYRDEWALTADDERPVWLVRRRLDGARHWSEMGLVGKVGGIDVSDGKTDYWLDFQAKTYSAGPHKVRRALPRSRPKPGTCTFGIDETGYSFASDPPIPIASIHFDSFRGQTVRHVLGRLITNSGTEQVDFLFWPDSWILVDATITTTHGDGPKHVVHWITKSVEKNVKFGPKDFALDPSLIKGLTRLPEGR